MAPTIEHLIERGTEIYLKPVSLGEDEVNAFLADFSLDFLFTVFQAENLEEEDLRMVVRALSKVFAVADLKPLLPKLLEYSTSALESKQNEVQLLGVEQLRRISQTSEDSEIERTAVGALIHAIENEELSVANAAAKSMTEYFDKEENAPLIDDHFKEALSSLMNHENSVVQMRCFDFVLRLGIASRAARTAIETAGFVNKIIEALVDFDDHMACLTCWDLFAAILTDTSLNETDERVAVMASWLQPNIAFVGDEIGLLDRPLKMGITKTVSYIIGQTATTDRKVKDQLLRYCFSLRYLLVAHESDPEMLLVAIDAAGQVGRKPIGAETLLLQCRTVAELIVERVTAASHPELRITARQTLAILADACAVRSLAPVEQQLKHVLHQKEDDAFWLISSLWRDVHSAPFEQKQSVYVLVNSLASRHWFTLLFCRHSNLRAHVIDAKSEVEAELSQLRYECLVELTKAMRSIILQQQERAQSSEGAEAGDLSEILSELEAGVRRGPYGQGVGAASNVPIVGTDTR